MLFFTASRNELREVAGDFDELAAAVGGGAFGVDARSGAVGFRGGESIFGFHIIHCLNRHGPQGHDLRAHDDANRFALRGFFKPLAEVLPGSGNGKSLHGDIIMSFI
jgi:hypothetical protein